MKDDKGKILIKHKGNGLISMNIKGNPPLAEMLIEVLLEFCIDSKVSKKDLLEELDRCYDIVYKAKKEKE